MSANTQPGIVKKVTSFPYSPAPGQKIRSIGVPSGGVTITSGPNSVTFTEAELPLINNLARYITSVDSATGGVVFVTT